MLDEGLRIRWLRSGFVHLRDWLPESSLQPVLDDLDALVGAHLVGVRVRVSPT